MISALISRIGLHCEQDVVYARQRARLIAELLGFDRTDQTRISTALSEIARNAYQYALGGMIEFFITDSAPSQLFGINVCDHGPGIENLDAILEGRYRSPTGMGLGILGSRRLMDHFQIVSQPGSTKVSFAKTLPPNAPEVTPAVLRHIAEALAAVGADSPLEEIRAQNQQLVDILGQLRERDEELSLVNHELNETNIGMVALYNDLSKTTEQLQQSEKRLQARNKDLKGFAYTVSHDLKAPLRGIAGYANELERKHRSGMSERALFCLSQILSATHNMDALIEDLLHYSRLDIETLSLTQFHLPGLIESILKDRSQVIDEQHIEVSLDVPDITLVTWERGLTQVLSNLIDNAIKYSRRASPPRLGIRTEELDRIWRLSVSDNGIGFDMKYHDRLFGLFARLVRAEEFEGTGAGLAIAKKVLEKINGTIHAESAPGVGATFVVEIPK